MKSILKYFVYFILIGVFFAAGLVVYLIWFQSPFYFPRPTGKYAVGVKTFHWIDSSRKEILHKDSAHPNRELMVNIWYPAEGLSSKKSVNSYEPYPLDYFRKNKKSVWILSWFSQLVFSYAQLGAALSPQEPNYPVLIFIHGCEATRVYNTAQCEELASNGYVVVAISNTYTSRVVQFPDGRIADGFQSLAERHKNKNFMEILKQFDQEIEILVSDIRFTLDQLEHLAADKKSIFYQRFDQENIGIFGHSYGGAAAAQICGRDARVKAGVALDGFFSGPDTQKKFDKPFMFMLSGDGVKTFERPWTQNDWKKFGINSLDLEKLFKSYYLPITEQLAQSIDHDVYTFIVKDAGHLDFCDVAFLKYASYFWRILMISNMADGAFGVGSIDGFRATEIINAYLVNFFDKYLKDKPSELLDGQQKRYEEVEVKR